jgi:low affinity Fe/Cu permease
MEYKFNQKLTEEDFLVFYRLYFKKTFMRPLNVVIVTIFFIVLLMGPFFGSPQTAYYAIGLAVFLVAMYFYMGNQGKKLYNRDPESFKMDYVVNEDTITFSSEHGSSSKMWSEFARLHEVEEFVFIYLKNNRGLIFKRAYVGNEAFNFIIDRASRDIKQKNIIRYKK